MPQSYDRAAQDTGNIVEIGHVNYLIPDQRLATLYYVAGLGLTRDPVMMVSTDNMWVNAGKSQFHLPTGGPVFAPCTRTGLVMPGRAALLERLRKVQGELAGTEFSFAETNECVDTTCPWGNRISIYEPDPARFGIMQLGMPFVEFDVPHGTLEAIAEFYRVIFAVPASTARDGRSDYARVECGADQALVFRESARENIIHKTHHVQIALVDFSGPYERLRERSLISEESNAFQYRFEEITDLATGRKLFTIDHEVRSLRHPLVGRALVNRNPVQHIRNYSEGHDFMAATLPHG
ncbi:MAG: hypothetical protein FJX29_08920 [Alphaproteobacteria bacterium]|nr:hypothetical protein [Alphaproteobacteria bacterium]